MSRWSKLLKKICSLSPDMRFDELRRVLESYGYNTKNSLNYGNLSPQNRIYQSFCDGFFSIILMVFIIKCFLRKAAAVTPHSENRAAIL